MHALPTGISTSIVSGGSPRHTASTWWHRATVSSLAARTAAMSAPLATKRRSSIALLRNRRSSWAFIWSASLVQALSGMASLGTRPHFLMMFIAAG